MQNNLHHDNLLNRLWDGVIIKDDGTEKDYQNQGRYLVHIPELMPHQPVNQGIWYKSRVHKWRYGDGRDYGEYKPLQMGAKVKVEFYENDIRFGYIVEVNSDVTFGDNIPFGTVMEDRDDVTLLNQSQKHSTLEALFEDTKSQSQRSYHFYHDHEDITFNPRMGIVKEGDENNLEAYNGQFPTKDPKPRGRNTKLYKFKSIWNPDGFHFWDNGSCNVTITKDVNLLIGNYIKLHCQNFVHSWIDKDVKTDIGESVDMKVGKYYVVNIGQQFQLEAKSYVTFTSGSNMKITSGGNQDHLAGGVIHIYGQKVYLGCGGGYSPANPKPPFKNKGYHHHHPQEVIFRYDDIKKKDDKGIILFDENDPHHDKDSEKSTSGLNNKAGSDKGVLYDGKTKNTDGSELA